MGLDDDVPIRKVLPFRDVLSARGLGLLLGMVLHVRATADGEECER